jgi:hypothetical protein
VNFNTKEQKSKSGMWQVSSGKYINFNILRNFPMILGGITGGKINNKSGHFKEKVIHVGITFWKQLTLHEGKNYIQDDIVKHLNIPNYAMLSMC